MDGSLPGAKKNLSPTFFLISFWKCLKNKKGVNDVMDDLISEFISEIEFGKIQDFRGMYLVPLYTRADSHDYLSLKEAIELDLLTITELDQQGSVPELKVYNKADIPVLILDGEELAGAKQNRIVNTTILLEEKTETVIPVSCTEQGRWNYISKEFKDSGVVAASRIRRSNLCSVTESLHCNGKFRSDQRAVWNDIDQLSHQAQVKSQTLAMRDVYQERMLDLDEYLESFPLLSGQKGLLVLWEGEVMGMDVLSSSKAYSLLHDKLVKSYSMETIFKEKRISERDVEKVARNFLEDVKTSHEEKHPSIGYGCDYRFNSSFTLGSSLVYQDQIIHAAFFSKEDSDKQMSSFQQRRRYRL